VDAAKFRCFGWAVTVSVLVIIFGDLLLLNSVSLEEYEQKFKGHFWLEEAVRAFLTSTSETSLGTHRFMKIRTAFE
jgi:hypothetical protein